SSARSYEPGGIKSSRSNSTTRAPRARDSLGPRRRHEELLLPSTSPRHRGPHPRGRRAHPRDRGDVPRREPPPREEGAHAPWKDGAERLLREFHAHAHELRARRQAPLGGRREYEHGAVERVEGRVALRQREDPRGDAAGCGRPPPPELGRPAV